MLKRWTLLSNYSGESWPDWYVFLWQNRDSDALERSNFRSALRKLGGRSETVYDVREGHWAVGWVEWIGIHIHDIAAYQEALSIVDRMEGYPVVDEDDWSALEYEEKCTYWEHASIGDRVEMCQDAGVSIFAARRDEIPDRVYDRMEV